MSTDDNARSRGGTHEGQFGTVLELIWAIKTGLLTTLDAEGVFHTRPVETLGIDTDGTLWFFTNRASAKVAQIRDNARVNVGYADPHAGRYVAVAGTATALHDPQRAMQLWNAAQRAFYPQGAEDARLAVLRVRVKSAQYWLPPGRTAYLVAAIQAMATDSAATVIGEHGALRFP